ncbi:serine/threonine-protein kinase [Actinomadura nitritigenes]|uniref:serine/threonine-protein kinase n=1 Tax=Actinomadura nitritigenes TaxID=134602 RepID=UPI003D9126F1
MGGWRVPGYSELRVLGEGAQGRVVLARHDGTGRPAAIKYLAGALAGDAEFRERFRGEADLLRRLHHPFVARLYGLVETADGAAIVMEAVDGASLKAVLAHSGPLAPEAALAVLKGSLLGLAAAHDLGIVHRDYKPANVIVRGDGCSKLIDFGIAVEAGEGGRSGTPVYMAPEQWRGEPASPATDVYAAACVFFECVTGHRPYTAQDQAGLMGRHLTGPIPAADVPEPLRPLIERGLAKSAWDRPLGAAAFVTELQTAASSAYGPDWETRGVRTLAGATAALSLLFPLTALGLGSGGAGAGAAAGGASAAGTAGAASGTGAGTAGTAGTATAGKGVLGALGAKGAAAVAGGIAVVAGGAAVYLAAGNGPARSAARPTASPAGPGFTASFVNYGHSTAVPSLRTSGRVVQVTGGTPAITAKVNYWLVRPVTARTGTFATALAHELPGPRSTATATPQIELKSPSLLSVCYYITFKSQLLTGPQWNRTRCITVDLRTGQPVATGLFTAEGRSAPGRARLGRILKAAPPSAPGVRPGRLPTITADDLDDLDSDVQVALSPAGLLVFVGESAYHGPDNTIYAPEASYRIPYAQVSWMLSADVLAAVHSPSPTPS